MRKKHQRYTIHAEINVVPFLDVLLILLIIFMMVPSQFIQGFEVQLPTSTVTTNIMNNNKPILTIEIKESELYNIIINNNHIKDIHLNQLYEEIKNTTVLYPDIVCLIAAAKNVRYDSVIQVLNLLNDTGIHAIGMITNFAHVS